MDVRFVLANESPLITAWQLCIQLSPGGSFFPAMRRTRPIKSTRERKRYWWRCFKSADHVFASRVCQMVKAWEAGTNGCGYCHGRKISVGDSLSSKYPAVAKLLDPTRNGSLKATEIKPGSRQKAWFKCSKASDHQWQATISSVTKAHKKGRSGCPYCTGRKLLQADSLLSKYPEIAKLWLAGANGSLKPSKVLPGSNKKAHFRCSAFHVWTRPIVEVVEIFDRGGTPCPFCRADEKSKKTRLN
jgi:hypothetical protein